VEVDRVGHEDSFSESGIPRKGYWP
jgi:hypothetical protein